MVTPAQVRAARALLDWRQIELAKAAHVGVRTVIDFEAERRKPIAINLTALRQALEEAGVAFTERGVEFADDGGVRPRARP
jgi:transcriptional regulator with XRE-family HTH domain